jgi:two-component system NtrC family sensor kinase
MSLKKKIILSFLISSVIIAVLAISAIVNFIEMRKEIRYLEVADSLRSKSLQLRRHEKNFFLYGDMAEIGQVYVYIRDIRTVIRQASPLYKTVNLVNLREKTDEYAGRFNAIERSVAGFHNAFNALKLSHTQYAPFFPLIESTFLERPAAISEILGKVFLIRADEPIRKYLYELGAEITALRKNGEEILTISKDLDKSARDSVENAITLLQTMTMVLFPLFFIIGFGTLFFIGQSVVSRLKILTGAIEKTGKGDFRSLPIPEKRDEVGVLITAFNRMERDLVTRDEELKKKTEELHRSRKLASIGTLASGVAHELNNPLNNIYISAQILEKEAKDSCSPLVREIVDDIVSQSVRVKRIVGDLLEYARGKEPQSREVELNDLIRGVQRLVKASADTEKINFVLNTDNDRILIKADPEQIERVFINLFTNAVEAMSGTGDIIVTLKSAGDSVKIWVSDTGKGMTPDEMEKVFEPFFTTKDKGTGLGLAIVFNIIKKHRGEVIVDSEKDKGTTFYITLPRGDETHAV